MFLLYLLLFLAVLGLLVFVHELGHFVAAKACNIYCDRFSLGMPPRLWGLKVGETDYCIGALPIGGYVKMAGQEDVPTSAEEREREYSDVPRERWFCNRPVWQRAAVVLAGPFMNLVLGIALYAMVAAVGDYVPQSDVDNRIGEVSEGSPAMTAPLYAMDGSAEHVDMTGPPDAVGWQTGDRIVAINGHPVRGIGTDVQFDAILGKGRTLQVEIERPMPDGTIAQYLSPVSPQVAEGEQYARLGIGAFETALVGQVIPGTPAAESGLLPGDVIVRANGRLVDTGVFQDMVENMPEGDGLELELERNGSPHSVVLTPRTVGRITDILFAPSPFSEDPSHAADSPEIVFISKEVSETTPLQRKDVIEEIDGQRATSALLQEIVEARPGQSVEVKIRRPSILFGLIQKKDTQVLQLDVSSVRSIGVVFDTKMVYYRVPPSRVIPEAFGKAYQALTRVTATLRMLIWGEVSLRDLGGPITIGRVVVATAKRGFLWFVETTAFISVNLCVINLLPLPVLDGGLLAFLGLEAVRRKPLSYKVLERIQQVGFAFIILLMLFVTYNDIVLWISSLAP